MTVWLKEIVLIYVWHDAVLRCWKLYEVVTHYNLSFFFKNNNNKRPTKKWENNLQLKSMKSSDIFLHNLFLKLKIEIDIYVDINNNC